MLRGCACVVVLAAGALLDAQPAVEPEGLLGRIQARMREALSRLPDHVCLQTVYRHRSLALEKPFQPLDTLKLEVGLAGNKEIFAWRDARRFAEKDLPDLVGSGAIGTGNFGLHARSVFLAGSAEYAYRGEVDLDGRRAFLYDYEVPQEQSRYHVRLGNREAIVGYTGSFWVDRETLDLIRLEVRAEDIPDVIGLAHVTDVMDYQRVAIGPSEFLLPRSSVLTLAAASGERNRNRTEFSGCRQFVGEASVRFEEAPPSERPVEPEAAPEPALLRLPARLVLDLSLATEIEMETAAAGDPVRALLARPLRHGDRILAPEGAAVLGRLVRVEKHAHPVDHYQIGLQFDTLETGGGRTEFLATLEEVSSAAGLMRQAKRLDPTFKKQRQARLQILVREHPRGQGVLHWEAKHARIRPGLRMKWVTEGER
ncbi:MAG: hypothetical protein HY013_21325 [Candidatus Solibacter usitatus]|nr:hypothetical protein [Candidatus Solibacter usitatus]